MSLQHEVASVATTDATVTPIYADTAGVARCIRALVTARETTGGSFANYRHWELVGTLFITFEANRLVTSTQIADDGSAGAAAWDAVFALNGSNQIELRVTGAASTNIEWRALIERLDT